jgi:hypothetical protein
MKNILFFIKIFLLLNLTIMSSCKTNKAAFDPSNTEKDFITFGNGGGISGQVKKYYFTNDGKIYLQETDNIKLVYSLPEKTSNQIFGSYLKLGLDKNILNEPGNRYYFLEMKTKEVNHALKWGKNEIQNPNIEKFYTVLMNLVKQKTEGNK